MRFVASLDKALHLRTVPLFGDLPADRLSLLVEYAREELIAAGTVFQVAGAAVERVRVIVEGEVTATIPNGEPIRLGADTVVGVLEYFAGHAPATLEATTDVVVLSIPTDAIRGMLEDHFDVVVHIFRGLGRTLIRELRTSPTLVARPDAPVLPPHVEHAELDEIERILVLRSTMPFRHAGVDAIAALAETTHVQRYAPGDVLWRETDDASWLGIILHGIVECETPFRPGCFYFSESGTSAVGFLDALGDDKRWYEARAKTDVSVLTIQKDDLLDILEDHFDTALACFAAFSELEIEMISRLRGASVPPPAPPPAASETAPATATDAAASNT
jgi:CRP-like cAMP-binding protein